MCLTLALSYSSKWEITEAVRQIAAKIQNDKLAIEDIDDNLISAHLSTNYMPDPDLLIRTGGEIRLSNYLLWQCAYSELYFVKRSGRTSAKKNFAKPFMIIRKENAVSAKPVNKYKVR